MKNQDAFTLWGVQEPSTGTLLRYHLTRDDARLWCDGNNRVVKLECRIVEQRPKKPRKPKTFTAHGLEWIPHTPGDPMPCDGEKEVRVLLREGFKYFGKARFWFWGTHSSPGVEIIGWNYAP